MDTRFLGTSQKRFIYATRERGGLTPFVLWPSCWVEKKPQGLSVSVTRYTFAWGSLRFHLHIGYRHGMPNPTGSLPKSFFSWASRWSGKQISPSHFTQWLSNSEYYELVKWGGTDLHYVKTLIVREFVQSLATPLGPRDILYSPPTPASSEASQNQNKNQDKTSSSAVNPDFLESSADTDLNISWKEKI